MSQDGFGLVRAVDRWLDLVGSLAPAVEVAAMLARDAEFVEHPNVFRPAGSRRDRAGMLAGLDAGRAMLARQSFDDRAHDVLDRTRVFTRATWRGELATAVGAYPVGTRLRADVAMLVEFAGGQVVRQENWDCYHPAELPG